MAGADGDGDGVRRAVNLGSVENYDGSHGGNLSLPGSHAHHGFAFRIKQALPCTRLHAFGLYGHTLAALLIDLFLIHEGGLAD